jgi:N-acetylglucosamine-6-sulfatase
VRARRPILLAAAVAALLGTGAGPAHARPNFVVVMTDDQTYRDMAAMPNTRRLIGGAGATFTRAYVSYPLCCPSRATFLTGRYAHNHGVRSTTPPFGGVEALDATRALPVWLSGAGYDTSHIGKYLNGYGMRQAPTVPPGWSDWHGAVDKSTYQMWGYSLYEDGEIRTYGDFFSEEPALYQTDVLRDKAVQVIDAHGDPGDAPFFLSLNFLAPHGEVVDPGGTTQPYVRPAPRHRGAFAALPLPRGMQGEKDVRDKPPYVRWLPRAGPNGKARVAADFRARRESLLAVDEAVAAIVAALEGTGELDSTYVLFTSDNGFMQGEHRIPKGKYFPYDPATHVPLLIRGPGIPAGSVSDELVANVDLAPTILDVTGAAGAPASDGRSLLPFARDPLRRTGRAVLHEGLVSGDVDRDGYLLPFARGPGTYFAIRTDRYLYVRWRGGARELYDLAVDPDELQSVHRDPRYEPVRTLLGDELSRLRTCAGETCRWPVPRVSPLPRERRPAPRLSP